MRFLGIAAAVSALCGSAQAAIVTYDLTFHDQFGAVVGSGVMTFDPVVKEDIWLDTEGGTANGFPSGFGRCQPGDPFCENLVTWTPVNVLFDIYHLQGLGGGDSYLEGGIGRVSKHEIGLIPDVWEVFNDNRGSVFLIYLTNGLPSGWFADEFCFIDPVDCSVYDFGGIDATLREVPLPAAAWLFLAGISGLGLYRRSTGNPTRLS